MTQSTHIRVVLVIDCIDNLEGYYFRYLYEFLLIKIPTLCCDVKSNVALEKTHGLVGDV